MLKYQANNRGDMYADTAIGGVQMPHTFRAMRHDRNNLETIPKPLPMNDSIEIQLHKPTRSYVQSNVEINGAPMFDKYKNINQSSHMISRVNSVVSSISRGNQNQVNKSELQQFSPFSTIKKPRAENQS